MLHTDSGKVSRTMSVGVTKLLLVKVLSDIFSHHDQFFNDSNDMKSPYPNRNAQLFSIIECYYIPIIHTHYQIFLSMKCHIYITYSTVKVPCSSIVIIYFQ